MYSPRHTSEWHCRWVTVLHAIAVVMLSAWSVFVQGPWPFTEPGNVSLFVIHVRQQAVIGSSQSNLQIFLYVFVAHSFANVNFLSLYVYQLLILTAASLSLALISFC